MLNIIKSQLYSSIRDIYTYVCLFICLLILLINVLTALDDLHGETLTGSLVFANALNIGGACGIISMFMFASRLCGWDMNDKTINYEVLYGHDRRKIYWSRVITAMTVSTLIAAAFIYIPFVVAAIINGWGTSVPASEALKRGLLLILPIIRTNAIIVFISVLFSNSWTSMLLGFMLYLAEEIVALFWKHPKFALFTSNLTDVITFDNGIFDFIDDKDVVVYNSTLSSGYVVGTIAVCVLETIALLTIGSVIFRKRDMS